MLAIELAWQTVGTAGVDDTVVHAWLAELLTNPVWGVVQYAKITQVKAILDIAELHRQAALGDMPASAAWDAADRAARAAACAMSPTSNAAGAFAVRAAYVSTTLVNVRHYQSTLDAAIAFAVRAHSRADADTAASRAVELARRAIRSWRHFAGLPTYAIPGIAADINDVPTHGKDERLPVDSYYHGVEFYYRQVTLLSGAK